ncbi:unnamed protein product [Prunus armeniaca]|uniref:Uncharacterized protein n=1 Tax=Prunus armeniaca TaxID=36596 RepID=A0A6J5U0K7_PRUAR|nr:unnamed protein product [Prunus armeniaca]CAB4269545.1 unnamed protein product [Prunus armeniaca]
MKGIDSVDPNFSGSTRTTFSCDKCSISPSRKEVVLLAQSSSSSTELIPTPIGICWVSPSLLDSPRSPIPSSLSSLCYAPPAQAVAAAFSPPNGMVEQSPVGIIKSFPSFGLGLFSRHKKAYLAWLRYGS